MMENMRLELNILKEEQNRIEITSSYDSISVEKVKTIGFVGYQLLNGDGISGRN